MVDKSYDDGVRDGAIAALEQITAKHSQRMDKHSQRIGRLDRFFYIGSGVVVTINFFLAFPEIKNLLGS